MQFYTIHNFYNGWEYVFNIYSADVESIVPAHEVVGDIVVENKPFELRVNENKVVTCYKKKTDRKNGLVVEFDVKRHNKGQVIDAVKSQLMYFPEVVFRIHNTDGSINREQIAAEVLMRNEKFIVSEQNYYRQPHVVIAGMNYGLIDFDELELERKNGALGIQITQEDVDLNPSRESLIWNDRTKEVMVRALDEVTTLAQEIVQAELKEKDLFKWLDAAMALTSFSGSMTKMGKVLAALRYLADTDKISPTFEVNHVKLTLKQLLGSFTLYHTNIDHMQKVTRMPGGINTTTKIYFDINARAVNSKDYYICKTDGVFSRLVLNYIEGEGLHEKTGLKTWLARSGELQDVLVKTKSLIEYDDRSLVMPKILEYVKEKFPSYDELEVPKEIEEKDIQAVEEKDKELAKAERAQEAALMRQSRWDLLRSGKLIHVKCIEDRVLVSTEWLKNVQTEEVYYGSEADLVALRLAEHISHKGRKSWAKEVENTLGWDADGYSPMYAKISSVANNGIYENPVSGIRIPETLVVGQYGNGLPKVSFKATPYVILMRIAQNSAKHMKGFHHINDFFWRRTKTQITVAKSLTNWNTARLITEELEAYWDISTDLLIGLPHLQYRMRILKQFAKRFYSGNANTREMPGKEELVTLLNRLTTLQKFVADNPETDASVINQMIKNEDEGATTQTSVDVVIMPLYNEIFVVREALQQIQLLRWISSSDLAKNQAEVLTDVNDFLSVKSITDLDVVDLSSYLDSSF